MCLNFPCIDLTLDRKYVYRLLDEDRVGERSAYVLAFEPAGQEAGASLYRGRVWIDKETFERLRASVIQTGLDPPVTSNEETDTFDVVKGPYGFDYRMLTNIKGQQIWIIGGRNVVVRRGVSFDTFEINPAADPFEARRQEAYASKNQMLRDTDEGFRYLERAVSIVLLFIGVKILLPLGGLIDPAYAFHMPTAVSLAVVATLLIGSVVLSSIIKEPEEEAKARKERFARITRMPPPMPEGEDAGPTSGQALTKGGITPL